MEMRPALEGHTGLAQVTRLLFRSLSSLHGVHVEGLLQSPEKLLARALPASAVSAARLASDERFNRLGRVVITLEEKSWGSPLVAAVHTIGMAGLHMLGGRLKFARFDASHFRDYIWCRLFAQTLPPADFDLVTRAAYRIARIPWNAMHICAFVTQKIGYPLFARLDTSDFDVMISQTPYPGIVSKRTRLVVHYHDALPILMPHTISKRRFHQAFHYRALRKNVDSGAWFVCVSEATRKDLVSIFPQAEARSLTIHNIVSPIYFDEPSAPDCVPQIIAARLNTGIYPRVNRRLTRSSFLHGAGPQSLEYLLMVSKIEPRKNHLTLLYAWEYLRLEGYTALKLLFVGPLGQQHESIVRRLQPWAERGEFFLLEDLAGAEIRRLYKHARATVCPSLGEGFDFSGVEAMRSGSAVVASDIPAHREIYANAAEFFNPHSAQDLCRAIREVIDPARSARRNELVAQGAVISKRYTEEAVLPQWESFLRTCASGPPPVQR